MDTVIYSLFTFRTQVPTTDDEGNTIEMTEADAGPGRCCG